MLQLLTWTSQSVLTIPMNVDGSFPICTKQMAFLLDLFLLIVNPVVHLIYMRDLRENFGCSIESAHGQGVANLVAGFEDGNVPICARASWSILDFDGWLFTAPSRWVCLDFSFLRSIFTHVMFHRISQFQSTKHHFYRNSEKKRESTIFDIGRY